MQYKIKILTPSKVNAQYCPDARFDGYVKDMTINMIEAQMSDLLWDDDFTRFTAADAIEIAVFLADSMG